MNYFFVECSNIKMVKQDSGDKNGIESFKQLGLNDKVLKVISEIGFEKPSEIQEKSIPLIIEGKDVIGKSATGSGKTLAFSSGILERVKVQGKTQSLILTPTRELAEQIYKAVKEFSKYLDLQISCVYGGVGMDKQERELRYADVVVGTPGRLLDHLKRKNLKTQDIRLVILDEADRMLEMGMIEDVKQIIDACPKERQTLLFSATISKDIEYIGRKYMIEPEKVEAKPDVDPSKLNQVFYNTDHHLKLSLLVYLLKKEKSKLVMVFCNTRRHTDILARNLKKNGLHAKSIHGGLTQNRRNQVMEDFHAGETLILICTDVAARGLDIKGVSHVYNYDSPKTVEDYTHRIGRTARAGNEGKAISIVSPKDLSNFRNILKRINAEIVELSLPPLDYLKLDLTMPSEDNGRQGKGRGRSGDRGGRFGGRGRGRSNDGGRDNGRNRGSSNGRERSSSRGYGRGNSRGSSSRSGGFRERSEGGSSRGYSRGSSKDGTRGRNTRRDSRGDSRGQSSRGGRSYGKGRNSRRNFGGRR